MLCFGSRPQVTPHRHLGSETGADVGRPSPRESGPWRRAHGRAGPRLPAPRPRRLGERSAARAFAGELLARGAKDPQNVKTRVDHGAHPDLTWVAPSGAHEMLRRDVDEAVVAAAAHTPFEASYRIFVLERADTLIEQAANALLKTLEEPPSYVVLLLLTDKPSQVLPTIASRCQPVRFDAPSTDQLAQRLQSHGVPPETADAAARLSLGDGEKALALALGDGPNCARRRKRWRGHRSTARRARGPGAPCSNAPARRGVRGQGRGGESPRRKSSSISRRRSTSGARPSSRSGLRRAERRARNAGARPRAPAHRPLVPRSRLRRRGAP